MPLLNHAGIIGNMENVLLSSDIEISVFSFPDEVADSHIIEFEHDEDFEEFFYFNIDDWLTESRSGKI